MSQRRVVVTGLGATTPLGGDVDTTWKALLAGQSGVRLLTEDWRELLPVHFAARVATEPADQMERVEMRRLDRSEQFALVASREAWKDAGSPDDIDKERLGVVIASGIGGVITLLDQFVNLNEKGARGVSPHTVPMLMPNGPAANVGLELQAKAGVHTPVSACASGAEAIGYAFEMIKNNRADIIVTGGVEAAIHQLPMAGFAAMKALSTRNDAPARASRPYDVDRDGFVLGEGGGILVIEEYEHAKARGAKIYCGSSGLMVGAGCWRCRLSWSCMARPSLRSRPYSCGRWRRALRNASAISCRLRIIQCERVCIRRLHSRSAWRRTGRMLLIRACSS